MIAVLTVAVALTLSCRISASTVSALFLPIESQADLSDIRQISFVPLPLQTIFGDVTFDRNQGPDKDFGRIYFRTKLNNLARQKKNEVNRETDFPLVLPTTKSNSGKELTGLRKLRQQTNTSIDYKLLRRLRSDPSEQFKLRKMSFEMPLSYYQKLYYRKFLDNRLTMFGFDRKS